MKQITVGCGLRVHNVEMTYMQGGVEWTETVCGRSYPTQEVEISKDGVDCIQCIYSQVKLPR